MKQAIYLNAINQVNILHPDEMFGLLAGSNNSAEHLWHTHFKSDHPDIIPEREWEKILREDLSVLIHPDLLKNIPLEPPLFPYPKLLTEIAIAPPILYVKGNPDLNFKHALAVVGSRKNSMYGRQVAEDIVSKLANHMVIISGLALGIDGIAHKACTSAGGRTIAVLANGLDTVYPVTNKNIVHGILSHNGSLVSEFPIGTIPRPEYFPRRNRIISGLALGTLIIEAALKSGSLITAYRALEQNRDLFAIPGSIYHKTAEGTNDLIARGAKMVRTAKDILLEYDLHGLEKCGTKENISNLDERARKIYRALSKDPLHTDALIKKINFPAHELNSALSAMELQRLIKNVGNGFYAIA